MNLPVMADTGALTDELIQHLQVALGTTENDPLVGDGVAPKNVGPLTGQPGTSIFRPYVVLVDMGAVPRALALNSPIPVWATNWSLRSFGGSRQQVSWMATAARRAVAGFTHHQFGTDPIWKVIGQEWPALGGATRVDATDPKNWQIFDTVCLLCDRSTS